MCGIIALAGNIDKDMKAGPMESMLSSLSLRGPDEKDSVIFPECALGHTRLSIVGLATGHQPMRDNRHPLTIVFNGEIYDYKKVKADLEKLGHAFSTTSDTEIILKAYAQYGQDCVRHIDGMFAFAIWDEARKELFIARDRFGKKPLYYAWINGVFCAASEIKAFFAANLLKGKIDPSALAAYLRLGYIPPDQTIYSNVFTLPPASAAVVKGENIDMRSYWKLEKKEAAISYDEAKKEIKKLFDEAVRKRMVADVEIGSLLSGGVDSTIVTSYAQKYSKTPIKTFAVGYEEGASELPFALQASKKIGTDHHTLDAKASDIAELRTVLSYFDEPHADSSDFPQHLVSKLAASKVKVALTGDGADELFMGYGWYQKHWHTPLPQRIFRSPFSSYIRATEVFSKSERAKLLKTVADAGSDLESAVTRDAKSSLDKINRRDLGFYLPGQLLTKIDRTSMMHSLEIRSPFLDTALVEFVYGLPIEFKLSKNQNKIILKDILKEIMPAEFVDRRKQGFGAPIQDWMKQPSIQAEVRKLLDAADHPLYKHLSKEAVAKLLGSIDSLDRVAMQKAWAILCLGIWFELHHENHE